MTIRDLHTHTTLSDGTQTVERLCAIAAEKGYELGISDHILSHKILTLRQIETYLDTLEDYPVYKGAEASIGDPYCLPPSLDVRMDYVIASLHSLPSAEGGRLDLGPYFRKRADHTGEFPLAFSQDACKRYLEQILELFRFDLERLRVDILGHYNVNPFYESLEDRAFRDAWDDEVLALCRRTGTALELCGLWLEPTVEMVRKAAALGVKLSLGSDCHRPDCSCVLDHPLQLLKEACVGEEPLSGPRGGCGDAA